MTDGQIAKKMGKGWQKEGWKRGGEIFRGKPEKVLMVREKDKSKTGYTAT